MAEMPHPAGCDSSKMGSKKVVERGRLPPPIPLGCPCDEQFSGMRSPTAAAPAYNPISLGQSQRGMNPPTEWLGCREEPGGCRTRGKAREKGMEDSGGTHTETGQNCILRRISYSLSVPGTKYTVKAPPLFFSLKHLKVKKGVCERGGGEGRVH